MVAKKINFSNHQCKMNRKNKFGIRIMKQWEMDSNYSKWKWNSRKFSNLLDIFKVVYSELAQIWRPTLLSDLRQHCDSFNRVSKEVSKNYRYRAKLNSIIQPKFGTSRNGLRSMKEKDLMYEKQINYWLLKEKWKKNFGQCFENST